MKKQSARRVIAAALLSAFASSAAADDGVVSGAEYAPYYPGLNETLKQSYGLDLSKMEFREIGQHQPMCEDKDRDGKADTYKAQYIEDNSVINGGYIISGATIEPFSVPVSYNDTPEVTKALNAEVKRQLFQLMDSSEGISITSHDAVGRLTSVMIADGMQIMAATTIERRDNNLVACPTTTPTPKL